MGNHVHVKSIVAKTYAVGVMVFVACLLLGFSCKGQAASNPLSITPPTNEVVIEGFAFKPATLSIPAGTTVTWHNNDSLIHTITARDNSFDSGSLSPGGTFTHTFEQKGTFEYYCKIHPSMTGKVIVE